MDARLDAIGMLGLELGDAFVIRNAGGRVTDDVIRSLALSQAFLGVEEVKVVHHTDCALGRHSQEEMTARLTAIGGAQPHFQILAFDDAHDALRDDLLRLRQSRFLSHRDRISGYLYDLHSGTLEEVG